VRSALFKVLERSGPAAVEALPALVRIVGEPASPARSEAEIVLNAMGSAAAPAVSALGRRLADAALDLDAVEALGHIGPAAAEVAPLLAARIEGELAREDSTWSAWNEEVGRRDQEPASPAPATPGGVTRDGREPGPYSERRIPSLACAEALVSIDPGRGNEALGRLLDHGIPPARSMALQRVAKLGRAAEPLRERVTRILADHGESASMAASALGRMGSAGCPAAGALARAVRDSTTADAALGALGTLASACPEAVEALIKLLDDRTTPRRAEVARAMANGLKLSDAAGRRLEAALRDPDPVVRAAAAWVLGKRDE
jgi:HEAT repeat protein